MGENVKSYSGRIFCYFDLICHNFKIFVGKHEKTFEIIFLLFYIILQVIIGFIVINPWITMIIILFLFLLALERIIVHIWLDYERKQLKLKEEELKARYKQLEDLAYSEVTKLKEKCKRLEDSNYKLNFKLKKEKLNYKG